MEDAGADPSAVPCAVFAYTRPQRLRAVLDALRRQDIDHLIIFVDGPRSDRELTAVERCRQVARGVDWIDTELVLHRQHVGLSGLADNVGRVLSRYHRAVFVEDDCLPMPGFYRFMCRALARYEEQRRVFSIAGYQAIEASFFRDYPYSVVSAARFICWGWATWRDRWQALKPDLDAWDGLFDHLRSVPDEAGEDLALCARHILSGATDSWAVKVGLAALWQKKVHLSPTVGLVRNQGVDQGVHRGDLAVSRRRKAMHNRNVSDHPGDTPAWIDELEPDPAYAERMRFFVRDALRGPPAWRLRLRAAGLEVRKCMPPPLRRGLRAMLTVGRSRGADADAHPPRLLPVAGAGEPDDPRRGRALLSYVVHPFGLERTDPLFGCHIHNWRVVEMANVLARMGFVVDAVDYTDETFMPDGRPYRVFVGHGAANFERIAARLPADCRKVYFSTGSYWRFFNEQVNARWSAFRARHGAVVAPPPQCPDEDGALGAADVIVGIGNDVTRRTYGERFGPVRMLQNTALPCNGSRPRFEDKDFDGGRRHFLFYASKGGVGKGVDLAIEAFAGLDAHLWICALMDGRWRALFRSELSAPNMHYVGWIEPRGARFRELVERCNYVLLPSCSEGQSHSVVECMAHGLIPVVSRSCGLDVDEIGCAIEPCSVPRIRQCVEELARAPVEECRRRAPRAVHAAQTAHSEQSFRDGFAAAMCRVLGASS